MTEQPSNEPVSKEIQFSESAQWHVEAVIANRITIMDAARRLQFLADNVRTQEGKTAFFDKMHTFVLEKAAEKSNGDEETAQAEGNALYEKLIEAMLIAAEEYDFTNRLADEASGKVDQTLSH